MTDNFHSSCKNTHLSFKSACNKEDKGVIWLPQIILCKALVLQDECFWKNYLSFLDFTLNYEWMSGIFVPCLPWCSVFPFTERTVWGKGKRSRRYDTQAEETEDGELRHGKFSRHGKIFPPSTTFVVCSSHLLMFLGSLCCKQYGSSLNRVHSVCLHDKI